MIAFFATRWGRSVALAALVMALGGVAYWNVYQRGADSVTDRIEEQNRDAKEAADEAELDFRDCIDAGRLWDFAASECRGFAFGPQ